MQSLQKMFLLLAISFIIALGMGWGCRKPIIHESGHAHYVPGVSCIVDNEVPQEEFSSLLDWCKTKYIENH